jgi:hypothetical protein
VSSIFVTLHHDIEVGPFNVTGRASHVIVVNCSSANVRQPASNVSVSPLNLAHIQFVTAQV